MRHSSLNTPTFMAEEAGKSAGPLFIKLTAAFYKKSSANTRKRAPLRPEISGQGAAPTAKIKRGERTTPQ
jgi:hypothetical protein